MPPSISVIVSFCDAYSYLISENVVFLTISDKSYPRKLAFSYLDELSKEFANTYGPKVESVRKPYAFVGFGALFRRFNDCMSTDTSEQTHSCQKRRDFTKIQGPQTLHPHLLTD